MTSFNQKVLALTMIVLLNLVVLVIGVGFGGILGLLLAIAFLMTSAGAAWRIVRL